MTFFLKIVVFKKILLGKLLIKKLIGAEGATPQERGSPPAPRKANILEWKSTYRILN
jgi:hypothetical protein